MINDKKKNQSKLILKGELKKETEQKRGKQGRRTCDFSSLDAAINCARPDQ